MKKSISWLLVCAFVCLTFMPMLSVLAAVDFNENNNYYFSSSTDAFVSGTDDVITPTDGSPLIKLVPGEIKDGKVTVKIVAYNCKGLTSADLVVKYDANVLNATKCIISGDAKAVK